MHPPLAVRTRASNWGKHQVCDVSVVLLKCRHESSASGWLTRLLPSPRLLIVLKWRSASGDNRDETQYVRRQAATVPDQAMWTNRIGSHTPLRHQCVCVCACADTLLPPCGWTRNSIQYIWRCFLRAARILAKSVHWFRPLWETKKGGSRMSSYPLYKNKKRKEKWTLHPKRLERDRTMVALLSPQSNNLGRGRRPEGDLSSFISRPTPRPLEREGKIGKYGPTTDFSGKSHQGQSVFKKLIKIFIHYMCYIQYSMCFLGHIQYIIGINTNKHFCAFPKEHRSDEWNPLSRSHMYISSNFIQDDAFNIYTKQQRKRSFQTNDKKECV